MNEPGPAAEHRAGDSPGVAVGTTARTGTERPAEDGRGEQPTTTARHMIKPAAPRSQTAVFSMLVRDFMHSRNKVLAIPPGTPCAAMIDMLAAERAG